MQSVLEVFTSSTERAYSFTKNGKHHKMVAVEFVE